VIRWITTYNHGDTGMQISGANAEPKSMWPSDNIIEFCESYNNRDDAEIDADGFAAKMTVGEGNRFEWCVSHNNCDDGWDLFTKKETGTIGVVTFYACISYFNGTMMDGRETRGGKNGFKLGGEGLSVRQVVRESLSFGNGDGAKSFTSNSNPALYLLNCTAIGSDSGSDGSIDIRSGDSSAATGSAVNCITAVNDVQSTDFASILSGNFLSRDGNGHFILGSIYKSKDTKGAQALYQ
jgi:hypothetical protein